MPTTQLGGPIGPFFDNVQQRGVPVSVSGSCDFTTSFAITDAARLDNDLRNQMLAAIRTVIGQKMATGQLQFRNLGEGTLGDTIQEIIAASGVTPMGIQVTNLSLRFAIDNGPPQHEVRAHVNVGGFRIDASSKSGVNAGSLANQAINKAKSAIIWYVAGAIIVAAVSAIAWWYVKHTVKKAIDQSAATSSGADIKWDGTATLQCLGDQDLKFTGVTAKLTTTAVNAAGSCHVTLVNCDITAPITIEAGGNASVTLQGGSLNASGIAIEAMGNSQISVSGTKITGKTHASSGAKITGI
jgi:hypothetical protein